MKRITQLHSTRMNEKTIKSSIISRAKQKATIDRTKKDIDINIKNVIDSQPVLNDSNLNNIINKNINKIPSSLQNYFINKVKQNYSLAKNKQQRLITIIQQDININKNEAKKYREKSNGIKEHEYLGKVEAGKEVLRRLKDGERFSYNNIQKFINSSGIAKKQEYTSPKTINFKEFDSYIQNNIRQAKTPSIKTIKDRFGVNLSTANEIYQSINKGVSRGFSSENTEDLIKGFDDKLISGLQNNKKNMSIAIPSNITLSDAGIKEISNYSGLSSSDIRRFSELNNQQKQLAVEYSSLLKAKKSAPTKSEITDALKQDVFTDEVRKLNKQLKNSLKYVNIPSVPSFQKRLSEQNKKDIEYLNSISKADIRKLLLKGDLKHLNNSVEAVNEFYSQKKKVSNQLINSALKNLKNVKPNSSIKNMVSVFLPFVNAGSSYRNIVILSLSKELQKIKKSGSGITLKQYQDYNKMIDDVFGLKELFRNIKSRRKNIINNNTFFKARFEIAKEIIKSLGRITKETIKVIGRDIKNLIDLSLRFGSKSLAYNLLRDVTNITASKIKNPESLLPRTTKRKKEIISNLKNTGTLIKNIIKNPEVVTLGVILLIAQGSKTIRKTIVTNPEQALAEIISVFAPEIAIKTGETIGKVAVKISPFAKNVVKILGKEITRTKRIRLVGKKLFKKNIDLGEKLGLKFTYQPSKTFRFVVKDADGTMLFFDKKSFARIRKSLGKIKFKETSNYLIENFVKANRKYKRYMKAKTKANRLALDKERKALRRSLKLEKSGKQPKAIRSIKKQDLLDIKKELKRLKKIFPETFSDDLIRNVVKSKRNYKKYLKNKTKFLREEANKLKKQYYGSIYSSGTKKLVNAKIEARLSKTEKQLMRRELRRLKKIFPEQFSNDLIENFVKANRKVRKLKKLKTKTNRLALDKERKALRRLEKIKKIKDEGKQIKAIRGFYREGGFVKKNDKIVYPFLDTTTKKIRYFSSRNKWLKTVKQQEKFKPSIVKTKDLFDSLSKRKKTEFIDGEINKIIKDNIKFKNNPIHNVKKPSKKNILFKREDGKNKVIIKKNGDVLQYKKIEKDVGNGLILKQDVLVKTETIKKPKSIKLKPSLKKAISKKPEISSLLKYFSVSRFPKKSLRLIAIGKFAELKKKSYATSKQVALAKAKLEKKAIEEQRNKVVAKLKSVAKLKTLSKAKTFNKVATKTIKINKLVNKKKLRTPKHRLGFNTRLKRGQNYLVNGRVKVGNNIRLLRLKTTPNRARNYMERLIDNTTARSYDLVLIGVTSAKDVNQKKSFKFTLKRGKNPKVRRFVEKSRYSIDTGGEKRGLKLSRILGGKRKKVSASAIRKKKYKPRKKQRRKSKKQKITKKKTKKKR